MPSPVSGLISDAASPASSTRPSGWRGPPGRQRQPVRPQPVGLDAGQQPLQPGQQRRPVDAAGDQLAVADVGPAVAERERPRVGRPALLGRGDDLDAVLARRLRRVAAEGDRDAGRGRFGRDAQRPADDGLRAVGTDDARRRVSTPSISTASAVRRAGGPCAGGTPRPRRARRRAAGRRGPRRGTTCAGRCIVRSTVAPPGERSRSRGTAGVAVGERGGVHAEPGEHVERLGGDAVAADLVAGEVGAVEHEDAGGRRGPAGGQGGGGPGRPAAHDDDVPVLHGSDATGPAPLVPWPIRALRAGSCTSRRRSGSRPERGRTSFDVR